MPSVGKDVECIYCDVSGKQYNHFTELNSPFYFSVFIYDKCKHVCRKTLVQCS